MFARIPAAVFLYGALLSVVTGGELEIKRWNPEGGSQPDGYSQVVTVRGSGKDIYLGGKAGIYPDDSFPESLAEQSALTWKNIERAPNDAGATREDVVEIQVYIVDLANVDPTPVYEDIRSFFPEGHKPVSMVIGVSALAYPGLLVEINVRAVVAD